MKCLAKGGPQMMHQLAYNMTLDQRPHFAWGKVADRITSRAAAADEGRITLSTDLSELHQSGILARLVHDATAEPLQAATMLRRLGRVSLPVGRIVEGHVNAQKLIALYGTADQRANATADATAGVIFGVWGADGAPAASFTRGLGSGITLSGEKRFCSGLGLVGRAIMTAGGADGGQLVLADVTRPDRADASVWQVSGMRATASGTYDLNGLQAECLGKPGDYQIEPYFEGGTWRYSALHVGGWRRWLNLYGATCWALPIHIKPTVWPSWLCLRIPHVCMSRPRPSRLNPVMTVKLLLPARCWRAKQLNRHVWRALHLLSAPWEHLLSGLAPQLIFACATLPSFYAKPTLTEN